MTPKQGNGVKISNLNNLSNRQKRTLANIGVDKLPVNLVWELVVDNMRIKDGHVYFCDERVKNFGRKSMNDLKAKLEHATWGNK